MYKRQDKVNAILDIENWEKVENIDKNINPIYTLELYYDTTKQDANDDIKEITIYSKMCIRDRLWRH